MANVSIRKYRNSDYDVVHSLFAEGMMEHLPATCFHLLKLPQVHLALSLSLLLVFMATSSYLLPLATLVVVLTGAWYELNSEFRQYVSQSQKDDLLDIEKTYMMRSNSCFWVSESGGKVAGMVAAQPSEESEDEMVLRRLSVGREHRMKGIAKALCLEVMDFARQCGYKSVKLETSMVQYAAHKLYESLGFEKTAVVILPTFFGRFSNFFIFTYRYRIKSSSNHSH
ncbi:probable N-acetyltransferase camello [Xenopus laevis]|nr:probable N-acetyltransferase camello [Xenopus laevis]XP_018082943.1 probable N-acetyltransferase camello [Xenopus laevis]XP_018082949.1 probable N-acetyltransferase camello [Xenopus laevis]